MHVKVTSGADLQACLRLAGDPQVASAQQYICSNAAGPSLARMPAARLQLPTYSTPTGPASSQMVFCMRWPSCTLASAAINVRRFRPQRAKVIQAHLQVQPQARDGLLHALSQPRGSACSHGYRAGCNDVLQDALHRCIAQPRHHVCPAQLSRQQHQHENSCTLGSACSVEGLAAMRSFTMPSTAAQLGRAQLYEQLHSPDALKLTSLMRCSESMLPVHKGRKQEPHTGLRSFRILQMRRAALTFAAQAEACPDAAQGAHPSTTLVQKLLQASASSLDSTGAGPIAMQETGPSPSGEPGPRNSAASTVATAPSGAHTTCQHVPALAKQLGGVSLSESTGARLMAMQDAGPSPSGEPGPCNSAASTVATLPADVHRDCQHMSALAKLLVR